MYPWSLSWRTRVVMRYPQKNDFKGVKWLTLRKEGFAWGTRGRGKLYRLTIKWTSSKIVVKDFPYTLRVPSTGYIKSNLLHISSGKMHISQELAFLWIAFKCHETWLFCIFSSKTALDKTSPSKCRFSDLPLLVWK